MEIIGKIIVALPEQSGVSKAGNSWKKKEYVLETQETYPKKVHFDLFGDKADKYPLSVGQTVKLSFDIESREYNGRWFTSIPLLQCSLQTLLKTCPSDWNKLIKRKDRLVNQVSGLCFQKHPTRQDLFVNGI